ncbi:MAG: helix-turn-helix transcriptional regulator [Alphaproteobacteria bacterium]|nr:helix-turn-helix transcriptional regulator [Alphaproteobacteria bacterium]
MLETITISFSGDDNMQVNIMRILSLYLAALRSSQKLKPADVCEAIGIHIKNLNRIETCKTTLANNDIGKLLNYYGLDVQLVISKQ